MVIQRARGCAPKDPNFSCTLTLHYSANWQPKLARQPQAPSFSQLNRFKLFPLITSDGKVQCGCNSEEL